MTTFLQAYEYAASHLDKLQLALQQHLLLVAAPLGVGLLLGLPLGLLSARSKIASTVLINSFNSLRVIPSLAILFIVIPYFGLGFKSAAIALTFLVMPPILISTDVAFRSIDPMILEAARGMGMSSGRILRTVEIPLALPVVIAGVKTATVEVIASATLAAFIGAGGLGDFVVLGFAVYDSAILLVGAIPVALMALIAEICLTVLQRVVQSPISNQPSAVS